MTPRRRANALQAHSLHCQGLTYRQIAERMHRSPSTIASYIKDFKTHRDEITESLAADQLVHSLAGINTPDPELHQQHITTARELRLQVDTIDRLTERRQRRGRRIQEEQIADAVRETKAAEELATFMIQNNLWDDPTPLDRLIETGKFPSEPDAPEPILHITDAPRPDAGPRATNAANRTATLSPPNPARRTPKRTSKNPANSPIKPASTTPIPDQTRTNPNKPDQDRNQNTAKQAKSSSRRRQSKKSRQQKPQLPPRPRKPAKPVGPQYPASWDNPLGYIPRRDGEIPLARQLFGRPMR